ncbi:PaaI family thioesterase [uncultured Cohaesibacter sp.]|uniref:PaaI family thioesterase n=1 Tax=uncultured Cohaesibacter sp. TaxID=1002546 RepID=UPI0029C82293|nr:PaaI family thioesterase [uncultured Cohaesibacter sp.]
MNTSVSESEEWKTVKFDGFMETIGPVLRQKRENGSNRYGLRVDSRHLNTLGVVHGGVIIGLLDQVLANEAWAVADRQPLVTIQLDTRFIKAAHAGDFLTCEANVRRGTRSLVFVDADLLSEQGDLVATATSIMKIVKKEIANG